MCDLHWDGRMKRFDRMSRADQGAESGHQQAAGGQAVLAVGGRGLGADRCRSPADQQRKIAARLIRSSRDDQLPCRGTAGSGLKSVPCSNIPGVIEVLSTRRDFTPRPPNVWRRWVRSRA